MRTSLTRGLLTSALAGMLPLLGVMAAISLWIRQDMPSSAATPPRSGATVAGATSPGGQSVAAARSGASVNIVAHPDDDLLFQNPDVLNDIRAGRTVRTIYLTAGDNNGAGWYWHRRELGVQAAYASMAGVADKWTTRDAGIPGHPMEVRSLKLRPAVSLVFMRLPDGLMDGRGGSRHGRVSLQKLYEGAVSTLPTVDDSSRYTLAQLRDTVGKLLAALEPTTVRTLDYADPYSAGDHSDHYTVGRLVRAAQQRVLPSATLVGYLGYPTAKLPANLGEPMLTEKTNIFLRYAGFDRLECQTRSACEATHEGTWLARRHVVPASGVSDPSDGGGLGLNVARAAVAAASSERASTAQTAAKAIDGVAGGYPGDATTEWASTRGREGSWLKLTWAAPVAITRVKLFDRPNLEDRITKATITFSDGTSVTTGDLPNDGASGTQVNVGSRSTSSITITITQVSPTTTNAGLAEVQVG